LIEVAVPKASTRSIESIKKDFKSLYDTIYCTKCRFYAGIERALTLLYTQNYELNIVTNKRLVPTISILKHFKVQHLFVAIKGSDNDSKQTNIKNLLLDQSKIIGSAVYIGDTVEDLRICQTLDLSFIGVNWGYGEFDRHALGTNLVGNAGELIEKISSL
jgi:phosphoglycolate phosphatase-like HAD superfamily hydrolase